MESNDLISREAAIAAVKLHLPPPTGWVPVCGNWDFEPPVVKSLKSLPADRRWDELRAWIVARQAKAESYRQWDDLWSMFDLVLDQMDRLAPPADGAENT